MFAPTFMNRQNRDRAWKAAGKPGHRTSIRNQLLHPQYVRDFPDKAIQADKDFPDKAIQADNDVGNCYYKTYFPALYSWDD